MTNPAYLIDGDEDVTLDRYRIESDLGPALRASTFGLSYDASDDAELEMWRQEVARYGSEFASWIAQQTTRSQKQLRKLLDLTGWSHRAVGEMLGISHTQVRRILVGTNDTRIGPLLDDAVVLAEKLEVVARALDTTVSTLLKRRNANGECAANTLRDRGLTAAMGTALRAANPLAPGSLLTAPDATF